MTAARTDLARAKAEAHRSRSLFAAGFAAIAALDGAAGAQAQAQGWMDRALRVCDQAANAVSYTVLVAQSASVVTTVAAEAGQGVTAGQKVAAVARTNTLDVVFALPEQVRNALQGSEAAAILWGDESRAHALTHTLTLRDIAPDVDPVTRT